MISEEKLKEILNNYKIDYEKLIKKNINVLDYGNYEDICEKLDYLRDEINIEPKNIEKCPSILYYNSEVSGVDNIKENLKDIEFNYTLTMSDYLKMNLIRKR